MFLTSLGRRRSGDACVLRRVLLRVNRQHSRSSALAYIEARRLLQLFKPLSDVSASDRSE